MRVKWRRELWRRSREAACRGREGRQEFAWCRYLKKIMSMKRCQGKKVIPSAGGSVSGIARQINQPNSSLNFLISWYIFATSWLYRFFSSLDTTIWPSTNVSVPSFAGSNPKRDTSPVFKSKNCAGAVGVGVGTARAAGCTSPVVVEGGFPCPAVVVVAVVVGGAWTSLGGGGVGRGGTKIRRQLLLDERRGTSGWSKLVIE
jgi:hypothetical protein